MDPHDAEQPLAPRLDRQRGLYDGRAQLKVHLADAPVDYLEGALDNPELGPDELVLLLRNGAATADVVGRVGRNRSWMRSRALKLAFVANPHAPQVLARQFLPHLFWRDLADLAANVRVAPVLRRESEKLLGRRLSELSIGERVALARRGSPGIVEMLREDTEALVLRALAGNPRATEAVLTRILARLDLPADFLGWLADQSPWAHRRVVRLALVRHPRTPFPCALRLIRSLSSRDIDELQHDVMAPRLVRVAAERHFAAEGAVLRGSEPHFG